MDYTIRLLDGKTLTLPATFASFYPIIEEQAGDIVGDVIVLNYPDSDALYTILSTDYIKTAHDPSTYIRLINAVGYLGNKEVLTTMLYTILNWFSDQTILTSLKQQKEAVKNLIGSLDVSILLDMIRLLKTFQFNYSHSF